MFGRFKGLLRWPFVGRSKAFHYEPPKPVVDDTKQASRWLYAAVNSNLIDYSIFVTCEAVSPHKEGKRCSPKYPRTSV